ncbi:protein phosphatase 2C-related protein [Tieghemostelium lacteum]|uniref:Protein phosphatase 2C-related protein n=1 Tax=Tieghemostelium lacteum TaxID=361077 RepID=A0A151ZL20_TIELA|nr:protein phosphatase 2C-related protein [Tieghemostelium lacteum]|eukprot:KYQ94484.1 protein phosphatase 2C-related protein [Tieghemostelium lacteum]
MSAISQSNSLSSNSLKNEFEYKYTVLLEEHNKLKVEYQELRVKYDQLLIQSISNQLPPQSASTGGDTATKMTASNNTGGTSSPSTSTSSTATIVNTSSSTSTSNLSSASSTPITTSTSTTPKTSIAQSSSSSSKDLLVSSGNSINKEKEKKMDKFLKFMHIHPHHGPKNKENKHKNKDEKSGGSSPSSNNSMSNNGADHNKSESDFDYDSKVKGLSTLYRHIPELEVIPTDKQLLAYLSGPDYTPSTEVNTQIDQPMVKYPSNFSDTIYAVSTSTYPFQIGNTLRDGDPIADRYTCVVYNNRLVTCLADGCNWGEKPKQAAQRASQAFIDHVMSRNDEITNVKEAGRILFDAFENAHKNILDGKTDQDLWQLGTTTLLGGVLLEINKGQDKWSPQWEFVCASVGDCKAFLITQTEIVDITEGNRMNLDAKDCGGRLGPHLDSGKPDLRNLNIFCASADAGDIIIMVSDGIHDNLDPHHLGKSPHEMSKEFNLSADKWSDIDSPKAMVAKTAYCASFLENLLQGTSLPSEIANRLLDHCWNTTKTSRHFLETAEKKQKLPNDYTKYPGKMDHTTAICFKVGHFANSTNPKEGGFQQYFGIAETPNKSIITNNIQKDWIKVSPSTKNNTMKKNIFNEMSTLDKDNISNNNNNNNSNNTTPSSTPPTNVNNGGQQSSPGSTESSPVLTSSTPTSTNDQILSFVPNSISGNGSPSAGTISIDQNPNLF